MPRAAPKARYVSEYEIAAPALAPAPPSKKETKKKDSSLWCNVDTGKRRLFFLPESHVDECRVEDVDRSAFNDEVKRLLACGEVKTSPAPVDKPRKNHELLWLSAESATLRPNERVPFLRGPVLLAASSEKTSGFINVKKTDLQKALKCVAKNELDVLMNK